MSDRVLMSDVHATSNKALIEGNITASMQPVVDVEPVATTPTAASSLTATTVSLTQINLSWLDNSTNETGFKIERCSGSTCTNFAQVATVGAGVKTFSNTGLKSRTAYRYRVTSYNSVGNSAYSNIVTATTK